jgi:hypothetical protein
MIYHKINKKDIEALEQVWGVAKEWETSYNDWKTTVFKTLETREMDDNAQFQFKKLTKMARDLRVIIFWLLNFTN